MERVAIDVLEPFPESESGNTYISYRDGLLMNQ